MVNYYIKTKVELEYLHFLLSNMWGTGKSVATIRLQSCEFGHCRDHAYAMSCRCPTMDTASRHCCYSRTLVALVTVWSKFCHASIRLMLANRSGFIFPLHTLLDGEAWSALYDSRASFYARWTLKKDCLRGICPCSSCVVYYIVRTFRLAFHRTG